MNNPLQQQTDPEGGPAARASVRSVSADLELLTETMAMLEIYVDSLLGRTERISGDARRPSK